MRRKVLLVSVLVLLMLFAAAPLMSLPANADESKVETTNVRMPRADTRTGGPQPQAQIWGDQKKWAYQYWYAFGQLQGSSTWPGQGILYSPYGGDSYAIYSFTLPAPPWDISYLDVGIYGKAVSGNGVDVHVWNWATSGWDFVATTPTAVGHKYWGVSPTNHVQGSSYEYRLRVYDHGVRDNDKYDMWYIDTYYLYTPKPYTVNIWSFHLDVGWMGGVPITMDGVPTGKTTGATFTDLVGPHTFTVPSTYQGLSFYDWDPSGIKSTSITVNSAGTWTARYKSPTGYSVTIGAGCLTEYKYISVPITKDGSPSGYSTPYTFTGLTGTHTFTVPSTDAMGHPFYMWGMGSTSTTITVSSAGTYYAFYKAAAQTPTIEIWTDKTTYTKGQTLTAKIQAINPGPAITVKVKAWFGLPNGQRYMEEWITQGYTIPASSSPQITWKSFAVPTSAAPGSYSVNAEMYNKATNALIDSDTEYFTIT